MNHNMKKLYKQIIHKKEIVECPKMFLANFQNL